jgi:hypothetical protein
MRKLVETFQVDGEIRPLDERELQRIQSDMAIRLPPNM